jgi:hypothetical protein
MATKKSTPGTKTTRGRSNSASESPAPNPTVEPVKQPVHPSVQVAASTTKPVVEPTKPEIKIKSEAKAKPEQRAKASPPQAEALSQPDGKGKPELSKPDKRFGVPKPEARKNVVPINLEEEIRRRAYELFLQRDPYAGSEAEDWLNAEREVMDRYQQQSA